MIKRPSTLSLIVWWGSDPQAVEDHSLHIPSWEPIQDTPGAWACGKGSKINPLSMLCVEMNGNPVRADILADQNTRNATNTGLGWQLTGMKLKVSARYRTRRAISPTLKAKRSDLSLKTVSSSPEDIMCGLAWDEMATQTDMIIIGKTHANDYSTQSDWALKSFSTNLFTGNIQGEMDARKFLDILFGWWTIQV